MIVLFQLKRHWKHKTTGPTARLHSHDMGIMTQRAHKHTGNNLTGLMAPAPLYVRMYLAEQNITPNIGEKGVKSEIKSCLRYDADHGWSQPYSIQKVNFVIRQTYSSYLCKRISILVQHVLISLLCIC